MIEKHLDLTPPVWNAYLWRYMGLDKFIEMLQSRSLYFANCANMSDQYEATIPARTILNRKSHKSRKSKNLKLVDKEINELEARYDDLKKSTLINCWSKSKYESYSLWKIYLGGGKSGVAIRTNRDLLEKSINSRKSNDKYKIYLGKVRYTDYISPKKLNWQLVASTKSPYYKSEEEIRLFIVDEKNVPDVSGIFKIDKSPGIKIKIDLNTIIDRIYLSPFSEKWFVETFNTNILKNYGFLKNRIHISSIKDK